MSAQVTLKPGLISQLLMQEKAVEKKKKKETMIK